MECPRFHWEVALLDKLKDEFLKGGDTNKYIAFVNYSKFLFAQTDKRGREMVNIYSSDFGDNEIRYSDKVKYGDAVLATN